MQELIEVQGYEAVKFEDVEVRLRLSIVYLLSLYQHEIFDMVNPMCPGFITLQDLIKR